MAKKHITISLTNNELLWGWLYLSGRTQRLDELVKLALSRTEELWQKQNSK